MGKKAEAKAGAIYRYHQGDLVRLFPEITIPNAICFAPDGHTAYFTDTPLRQILAVNLDADGWPCSAPRVAVDLTGTADNPDGAVVDAQGNIWNAQWDPRNRCRACHMPRLCGSQRPNFLYQRNGRNRA